MTLGSRSDAILSRIRWSGALPALAALATLAALGPPGYARAAGAGTGYDQISGIGSTDSAVTASWKSGLLDSSNQPIASANAIRGNPTGPLSFMYQDPDFQNLQVTVSQTQNINHQGITVSWQGALPTNYFNGVPATDFLQLMECYGDSSSGPSPQNCEYGNSTQLGSADWAGNRFGDLCVTGAVPSVTNPPASPTGDAAPGGCDTGEPVQGASAPDIDPAGAPGLYTIPFVPAAGCDPQQTGCPAYEPPDLSQYFDTFNTNELDGVVTGADGTGQQQFETVTNTESPGLGCGQLESNGQPRNCWLVIVPRGQYEPNGYKPNSSGIAEGGYIFSSPLGASNWAMRIQIHLSYAPETAFCPIGTKETETVGTQIVARAVQSWQLALNKAANCARIYGYAAVPEATSTQQLATQGSGVGLAFTTIPIGSEAARPGGGGGTATLPPILYAPVAVTAVGFGFNISVAGVGYDTTPVRLSPELLAKALTQVYLADLPDYYPNPAPSLNAEPGPTWAQNDPLDISYDQQFKLLNPSSDPAVPNPIWNFPVTISLAPMLTEDHSALNQQIWQWIQADPGASAWLDKGTLDSPNDDTAQTDPDYTALQLGTPPAIDSFPRAYSTCLNAGVDTTPNVQKPVTRCSLDLLPYVSSYDQAAANILSGYNPVGTIWDSQATAPDGTQGWWDKNPPETIGHRWIWGITGTSDLAAYGLIAGQLCSNSGTNCVGPSTASLTTAVDSATPDSAGLLQVNPASPGAGGYPLTQVVYAAVATSQSPADLSADADLVAYAAGAGQTPGAQAGDLPPGYLPLSASLQAKATAVVNELRADAQASTSPSPSTSNATSGTSGGGTDATSLTPSGGGNPVGGATPTAGPGITPPHAELAAQTTRPQPVGTVRWLLLAVVIAGAACAVSGAGLRSDSVARWLHRMRS